MRVAGTIPRSVDPAHHDKIVREIASNLAVLEESGLFDPIELYSRSRERLYPAEGRAGTASEALRDVLFGAWNAEEQEHYEHLKAQLASLKEK